MHHEDHEIIELLEQILALQRLDVRTEGRVLVKLDEVLALLKTKPILTKGRINLMPATIQVGQTANAVIQAFDQFGQPFDITGLAVQYVASAPGDVSFGTVNADGSDTITGVAADPGDSISANITRADGTVITAAADVLVITTPTPVLTTATVVLTANAGAAAPAPAPKSSGLVA